MYMSKPIHEGMPPWLAALPALLLTSMLIASVADTAKKGGPSMVESVAGKGDLHRITLTKKAAERLDIKTAKVDLEPGGTLVAPYSAVLYDTKGQTWVYTNPQPLVYLRHPIVVDSISGQRVLLKAGPPAGTVVVTVGVAELYGAESGVGH